MLSNLRFWPLSETPYQNLSSLSLILFPLTKSLTDEDDELLGETSGGLTDDEGIEDDHEETESVPSEAGLRVRSSGTCEALISLCR